MEIKIGQPISHQLAIILRERTTEKEREVLSSTWEVHENTLKNRLKDENRISIQSESDANMILELCKMAFRNNSKELAKSHNYEQELKRII